MILIDNSLLDNLTEKARKSERKRINFNFHKSENDLMQRMLIAIEPDSYVQPHKHENPDKREAFWILRGKLLILIFNNEGIVSNSIILDREINHYGFEIEPRIWHSVISLKEGTVYYEVKDGPYNPENDKIFAPFAPTESDPNKLQYLNKLKTYISIK